MEEMKRTMEELKKQCDMLKKNNEMLKEKVSVNEHKENISKNIPRKEYVYHCWRCNQDIKYKQQCTKKVSFWSNNELPQVLQW